MPGCGSGSGCDAVMSSRWGRWGFIPVAVPGAAVYLAILIALWFTGARASTAQQKTAWSALVVLSATTIGAVLWFSALQLFVIKRICAYCMAGHLCGLTAASLILWGAPFRAAPAGTGRKRREAAAKPVLPKLLRIAGILLGVLIVGQLVFEPKTHSVTPAREFRVDGTQAPLPDAAAAGARVVSLFGGSVRVAANSLPLLGRADAPHIVLELFDYTCASCRAMHPFLKQARQRYGQQLAILVVPVPIHPACNPVVAGFDPQHQGACEYAQYALAVWKANPQKFAAFHEWLLESPKPLPEAQQYAEQLVGADAFRVALTDPVVVRAAKDGIRYYQSLRGGRMPKLVLPGAAIEGPINSADDLFRLLEQQLGVAPLPPAAPGTKSDGKQSEVVHATASP